MSENDLAALLQSSIEQAEKRSVRFPFSGSDEDLRNLVKNFGIDTKDRMFIRSERPTEILILR